MLHPPLGSSQLLGSSSTTSKEFLLLASLCPVAWIQGGQAYSPGFGPLGITSGKNHREQTEHEAAHITFFTACWGLEFCRKSSDMMVTSSQA